MLLGQGYCTARGVVTEEYIATMEQWSAGENVGIRKETCFSTTLSTKLT
jgi:hypothetical protein